MRTRKRIAALLLGGGLVLAPVSQAASKPVPTPHVTTTGVNHLQTTSAVLNAVIYPNGISTNYYFQYGPTAAYGFQTPTVNVGSATTKVKVGRAIAGLTQGVVYHYRVVGVYGQSNLVLGRDRTFTPKRAALAFTVTKQLQAVVGTPFILSGTLTGFGNAHRSVALEASPYPYLAAFTSIGVPAVTDAVGRFSFRVSNVSRSTQFRVRTVDLRPTYSPVMTAHATVRVTLHARSSGRVGLVRLFGTVTPAAVGAQVQFQLEKQTRPRTIKETEQTTRFITQFSSVTKKAGRTYSRFSLVVKVRRGGHYRAFVKLRPGPLASGASTQTVLLHAAPSSARKTKVSG
jgi:hypothetical protein